MPYIGNTVQNQGFAPAIDYFNGDGVTVTFTLSRPIASVAQVIVAVDNVIQNPSSAFGVVGNSITFTSAPLSGTNNIWVEYTSLITTFQGISQDPTVIGDIRATGGYLAEGDFGNSFIDGAILDYVTGNGRITVGDLDGFIIYNGGTAARAHLLSLTANGALGVGTSPSYGTAGQVLTSQGSSSPPQWTTLPYSVSYLLVAGGGAGGGYNGGGGGAGGYITGTATLTSGTTYSFTIGAGGAGTSSDAVGGSGGNTTGLSLTATGGGGGGYRGTNKNGASGGSGGGGCFQSGTGGSGTSGQGNAGASNNGANGAGSGGGGASAAGVQNTSNGGAGGAGTASSITGSSVTRGGGGGGGSDSSAAGAGGAGGGGAGSFTASAGTAGTANTGGGGGGGGNPSGYAGGNGGSGVVILSVPTVSYSGTTTGSPTVTTSGSNTILTFNASGSYTA
jgi:hypothetical protein